MATILRPRHFYASYRAIAPQPTSDGPPLRFGAKTARRFERTRHVLAQLIDTSLTAAFLVAGMVQAVLLCFMAAGQTLG